MLAEQGVPTVKTKIKLEVELEYDGKMSKEEVGAVRLMVHSRVISQMGWGSLSFPNHDITKFPEVSVREYGYKAR
jgi:hypothetical protein